MAQTKAQLRAKMAEIRAELDRLAIESADLWETYKELNQEIGRIEYCERAPR